jgi:hypothetical protein
MRVRFYALLLSVALFIACPCSMTVAGEKKTHSAKVRLCVYWIPRSDPAAERSRGQFNRDRSLVYQLERKGCDCEKKKDRALWHI